ncbi:MAG: hypothetical protein JSS51_04035 [Planctomycetes bacterium]|nr:hypothetical protein [Planctomycetota bacterium]
MNSPTPNRAALRHTARVVLDALQSMLRDGPRVLGLAEIEREAGVSRRSVIRSVRQLTRAGFIRHEARRGKATTYTLN